MSLAAVPGKGWAGARGVLRAQYGGFQVPKPHDVVPTLCGGPDDMTLGEANRLLVQANRWLEYVGGVLAWAEVERDLCEGEAAELRRRLVFTYGKVEKAGADEHEQLLDLERAAVQAAAGCTILKGAKASLDRVQVAASRTITAHTGKPVGLVNQQ